ncbi:hypothetical protein NBZ79_11265 [Sneathiella marina]|uniref:Uncharacterized protein n=1 Tax=Sneathiella marina TaxID=2950108 RepID=A0ABY4W538_9PROT|nr:hypothetical protein [Sneathiella marina]USG59756.1 hypothetical protein NBZ79_11265 [Sneathiella marina]
MLLAGDTAVTYNQLMYLQFNAVLGDSEFAVHAELPDAAGAGFNTRGEGPVVKCRRKYRTAEGPAAPDRNDQIARRFSFSV